MTRYWSRDAWSTQDSWQPEPSWKDDSNEYVFDNFEEDPYLEDWPEELAGPEYWMYKNMEEE